MPTSPSFRALHIDHSATMLLPMPLEDAMAFFTPEGERAWVEGWDPEYLYRSDDDDVDTAFRTTHGGEETLWMVLDMDLEEGSLGYARITPGSRMGTVMIDGEVIDATSCWITVTYELTALSPAGNALLKAMTPSAYKAMIGEWERRIKASG